MPRLSKKLLIAPAAFGFVCAAHILSTNYSFSAFTKEMFQNEISSSTISLHYTLENPESMGISDYSVTLGTADPETLEASAAAVENYRSRLDDFSYRALTGENRLTYDILDFYLETQDALNEYPLYAEPLGATISTQAQLPVLLAEYAFYEPEDTVEYLKLLQQMDVYYDSILSYEKAKSEAGLFMSDANADSIITQCQAFIANPEENFLIATFEEKVDAMDSLTDADRTALKEKNREIIREHVIPAYENLIMGLQRLKGTGVNENGLCYYPEGEEYYTWLVRQSTGCAVSPATVQERIQDQLLADYDSLRALAAENPDILDSLGEETGGSLDPAAMLTSLQTRMTEDFPAAPSVSCQVKYVHESLEDYLSPAFYLTPPLDNLTENVIYINRASDYTWLELYTTLAHEGYPGHLYQTVYSGSCDPSPVRSLLDFGGYTEGWATYVEMLSWDYTGLESEVAQLYRLNRSISLGFSALADIAVHYKGYTREDIIDYLDTFGYSAGSASALFDMVVEAPANYLQYYVGYLCFLDLRKEAAAQAGDGFSLMEFHRKILETGPAPFPVLADYVL